MLARCSKAFFRALQVLGSDVKLRVEAARWEFEKNKSIDNARLHLQLGLRSFPESHLLWITFFHIEILNVDRLLKRRRILMGNDTSGDNRAQMNNESGKETSTEHIADESTHSDAILNLKLAEVIAEQALSCPKITDKNVFNFSCIELQGDMYEIFDEAIIRFPTPKMFRHYIGVRSEDMLEIYQLAIDWAISNLPSTVDAIFRRAIMLTPPDVSSEIKCIQLRIANILEEIYDYPM
uniref:BACK domain-containing protein n=1 Tax=Parascaris univalens TaxID=6257 RepID=A0A915AY18_PARUN